VFVDCEPDTWNIDPRLIEAAITPKTRGIIVVHLFGHPVDMDPVLSVARRRGLWVIEDSAQAHGAEYRGKRVGTLGDAATFSFFGNKIITTGEGGMLVTNNPSIAAQASLLKNHGMDPKRRYWHPVVGYNYRMTNVAAAIGLAQLERFEEQRVRRLNVISWYRECLNNAPALSMQHEKEWARHAWWMFSVVLGERGNRDRAMAHLDQRGIETRPFVHPLHTLPPYRDAAQQRSFPESERIASRGINLPTGPGLGQQDVRYICDALLNYLDSVSQ
jgi:perosamine synthetase